MSIVDRKRIELWVEPRGGIAAVNPVMQRLLNILEEDGARVTVRVPEHEIISPGADRSNPLPDLILLKSATSLGLSRALAEEARGVRVLNGALETCRANDKALVIARLAAAGLPVPTTYLAAPAETVSAPPPESHGQWVTKPTRGVHGNGVAIHEAFPQTLASSLSGTPYVVDDGTRLLQRRVDGDAPDIKVYIADRRCFAGRKRFAPASYAADEIEPVTLDSNTTAIVLAAGDALELRCFGVDLRLRDRDPMIIDVNPFPGYRGFPAAVAALRSEIEAALRSESGA